MKKLFRVADRALVVYDAKELVGVKHADGSRWLAWIPEQQQWDKASSARAKEFDRLPLEGDVRN